MSGKAPRGGGNAPRGGGRGNPAGRGQPGQQSPTSQRGRGWSNPGRAAQPAQQPPTSPQRFRNNPTSPQRARPGYSGPSGHAQQDLPTRPLNPEGGGEVPARVFEYKNVPAQIDGEVMDVENKTSTSVNTIQLLKRPKRYPLRPGYNITSQQMILYTNYFQLDTKNLALHRYSIEVREDRPSIGKKLKRVIELALEKLGSDVVTDFTSNLYSKTKLSPEKQEVAVLYYMEGEDKPSNDATRHNIRLQYIETLTVNELVDYLKSPKADRGKGEKESIIQALNIVIGHHPKAASNISSIGSNIHFDMHPAFEEQRDLKGGLSAMRGYFVSVRAATNRIALNMQVKPMAMYNASPVRDAIEAFQLTPYGAGDMPKLASFLKGVKVNVNHLKKKMVKTIQGLATPEDGEGLEHRPVVTCLGAGVKDVKFWMASDPTTAGKYVSVHDHFVKTYSMKFSGSDLRVPVLRFGTREKPTYLPAQVCEVVPGQVARPSDEQVRSMKTFAVRKPHENAESIDKVGRRLLGCDPTCSTQKQLGINVAANMMTVPGRLLEPPRIMYEGKAIVSTKNGSWDLKNVKFVKGATICLANLAYLRIASEKVPNPDLELKEFLTTFMEQLRASGIGITETDGTPCKGIPRGFGIDVKQNDYESQIDGAFQRFATTTNVTGPPRMILVISSFNKGMALYTKIYNRVKVNADIHRGIHTVCVLHSKFAKPHNEQYFANVAMKVNLKLGGINHNLEDNKLGIIRTQKTMIVGLDVTHPSPGSDDNAPSIAAIAACVRNDLAQWPVDLRIQKGRKEIVESLGEMLKTRLKLWADHNDGSFPDNIIVYRDGVSEGQYKIVLEQELPALRNACDEIYPASYKKDKKPKMTVIIVSKRHNTRFYPAQDQGMHEKTGNARAGLLVDRSVTEARNFDFFMQSHHCIQGTARPTYYYVVHDEIFSFLDAKAKAPHRNSAEVLQNLTNNMCHMFGRATKAVRVVPPVYYADIAAERGRKYLSEWFDPTSGTASTNVGGAGLREAKQEDITPKDLLKDSMFYI